MPSDRKFIEFDKPHRLSGFDYSSVGSYMLTFTVKNREPVLSEIVCQGTYQPPRVELKPYGIVTEKYIKRIESVYKGVKVENYVIMPDHVHLLLTIEEYIKPVRADKPRIAVMIGSTKAMITKEIGRQIWQEDFYDTIADSGYLFMRCDKYIDDNPAAWLEKNGVEPFVPK